MPFTFSHPSVVLIIKKILPARFVSLTAMIVGSIIPDFEGFILLQSRKTFSHTWAGMFFFDFPLGLILCFLWHNMVKGSFIDNLPPYFKRRFYMYRDFNWNAYFKAHTITVILSLLAGILTHLVWDNYAHINDEPITVYGHDLTEFLSRQYISSLVGFVIIILFFIKMPVSDYIPFTWNKGYWLIATFIATIVVLIKCVNMNMHLLNIEGIVYMMAIIIISGFMLGILCASIIYLLLNAYRK